MIADLLLFTAGTVLLTVLTMDWKKKDIVQKLQSSSLFCGGIITALQLIVLFSKFEGMLNDKILVEEYFTQLGFMMTVLVKFRPLLFGVLCKLALKPFVEKSERKEIDRARAVHTDFSKLSVREAEVARLAARGYSNSQIADELFISVETVKRHMATVFEKRGIDSRKELKL